MVKDDDNFGHFVIMTDGIYVDEKRFYTAADLWASELALCCT